MPSLVLSVSIMLADIFSHLLRFHSSVAVYAALSRCVAIMGLTNMFPVILGICIVVVVALLLVFTYDTGGWM